MPPATVLLSAKYAYRPEYAVESSLSKGNSFFERSAFHLSTIKPDELEVVLDTEGSNKLTERGHPFVLQTKFWVVMARLDVSSRDHFWVKRSIEDENCAKVKRERALLVLSVEYMEVVQDPGKEI